MFNCFYCAINDILADLSSVFERTLFLITLIVVLLDFLLQVFDNYWNLPFKITQFYQIFCDNVPGFSQISANFTATCRLWFPVMIRHYEQIGTLQSWRDSLGWSWYSGASGFGCTNPDVYERISCFRDLFLSRCVCKHCPQRLTWQLPHRKTTPSLHMHHRTASCAVFVAIYFNIPGNFEIKFYQLNIHINVKNIMLSWAERS